MSFTGLKTINATDLNLDGEIRLGSTLDPGTAGQVIVSQGETLSATWGTNSATLPNALTMGTNLSLTSGNASFHGSVADTINAAAGATLTGGNGIDITGTSVTTDNDGTTINNTGGTGGQNQVLKVPNALTKGTNITFSSGTTYDGSAAITINATDTDTQLNLTAALPVVINNGGGLNREVELQYDANTLGAGGGALEVLKVPNALTKGTNITFSSGTTYDGSSAITINATDTNTEYTAGTNLNLAGTTFNLDTSISGMINISFLNDGTTTSITGSNYPGKETSCTDLNLTDTSNIISPYFFHDVYDPSSTTGQSLTTSYVQIFSGNLKNTFTAKATSCCIEIIIMSYTVSSNRWLYLQLADNKGTEWSVGSYADGGGTGTGTRDTERLVHYPDETDRQIITQTWYLQGLTIGNTYTINPQAKTSATTNQLWTGGIWPACICRGYYLPATGI